MADDDHGAFMEVALAQARQGLASNDVPIGAAAVMEGDVVAAARWQLRPGYRLLDHPELIALQKAERAQPLRRAGRGAVTLYTTLEPCLLCMGAAMTFLASRVVFALEAPSDGASRVCEVWQPTLGHPSSGQPYAIPEIIGGVGREESLALIREFIARNPDAEWAKTLVPALE